MASNTKTRLDLDTKRAMIGDFDEGMGVQEIADKYQVNHVEYVQRVIAKREQVIVDDPPAASSANGKTSTGKKSKKKKSKRKGTGVKFQANEAKEVAADAKERQEEADIPKTPEKEAKSPDSRTGERLSSRRLKAKGSALQSKVFPQIMKLDLDQDNEDEDEADLCPPTRLRFDAEPEEKVRTIEIQDKYMKFMESMMQPKEGAEEEEQDKTLVYNFSIVTVAGGDRNGHEEDPCEQGTSTASVKPDIRSVSVGSLLNAIEMVDASVSAKPELMDVNVSTSGLCSSPVVPVKCLVNASTQTEKEKKRGVQIQESYEVRMKAKDEMIASKDKEILNMSKQMITLKKQLERKWNNNF